MNVTPPMNPDDLADALTALREHTPLVQCLTNIVVAEWTANVLLAVGAAPAMVDNPQEPAGSRPWRVACWSTWARRMTRLPAQCTSPVSYTHLRAHETDSYLVCR